MTTEKSLPCAVWNADKGEWVILDTIFGLTRAATLRELVQQLGDVFPMLVRFPGNLSTVEAIH